MKKIFILLSAMLLCGCNNDTSEKVGPKESLTTDAADIFGRIYELYNINLSSDSITHIGGISENETNVMILGRKYNNAWIGVYDLSGSELFSHIIEDPYPDKKYSHFNINSIIYLNDDVLFLRGWYSNMADFGNIDYNTLAFLSMVNMKNGKEIKRFITIYGTGLYSVEVVFDAYLVTEGSDVIREKKFYMMKNGAVLWERQCKDYENQDGIDYYYSHKFIDYEKIIYMDSAARTNSHFTTGKFGKIINLKESELLYEFDTDKTPFHKSNGNEFPEYKIDSLQLFDNRIIQLFYTEYSTARSTDPISGQIDIHRSEIENYRYDIEIDGYSILHHLRLSDMSEVTPAAPDGIIGSLRIGLQFHHRQDGVYVYLTIKFETNINASVKITDLVVYDENGVSRLTFSGLPTEREFLDMQIPVDVQNISGWWAEIEFIYEGNTYRIKSSNE
jgi:hypothetical protein